jgi:hypothetical protein
MLLQVERALSEGAASIQNRNCPECYRKLPRFSNYTMIIFHPREFWGIPTCSWFPVNRSGD